MMNVKKEDTKPTFEGWAILELYGHRQLAGMVREVELFGGKLCRIDIPEVPEGKDPYWHDRTLPAVPAFTQFYGAGAIFSLTPTTEDVARKLAARARFGGPVMELGQQRMLVSAAPAEDENMEPAE